MPMARGGIGRDVVVDAVVVVSAVASSGLIVLNRSPVLAADWWLLAGLVGVSAGLWWRRRAPIGVAWVVALGGAVMAGVDVLAPDLLSHGRATSTVWIPPATPFAVYGATAFAARWWAAWPPAVVLGVAAIAPWQPFAHRIGPGSVLVAVPALLGMYVAARRRLDQALIDRAERAERERHLLAEQARADERARLAAEMHDLVTHRVTLMVLQAGAMRATALDEQVRTAVENLRATGCQALEELRHLVTFLRDTTGDGSDTGPTPREPLPDLSPLVAASESVGVPVQLRISGTGVLLSPAVGRTVYRVVQEALTNVRKHAPGAEVEIDVDCAPDRVDLGIRNTPATGHPDQAWAGRDGGTGLLGLRRRVEVLGGTLRARPLEHGGFHVEARLPTSVTTSENAEATA